MPHKCRNQFYHLIALMIGFVLLGTDVSYATVCIVTTKIGSYINTVSLVMILIIYGWFLVKAWKRHRKVLLFMRDAVIAMVLAIIVCFSVSIFVARPIANHKEERLRQAPCSSGTPHLTPHDDHI
tara:strand:+ start:68 stop:442 length:375 start_codon:yes stop_codon:yes gene_type:complete